MAAEQRFEERSASIAACMHDDSGKNFFFFEEMALVSTPLRQTDKLPTNSSRGGKLLYERPRLFLAYVCTNFDVGKCKNCLHPKRIVCIQGGAASIEENLDVVVCLLQSGVIIDEFVMRWKPTSRLMVTHRE